MMGIVGNYLKTVYEKGKEHIDPSQYVLNK